MLQMYGKYVFIGDASVIDLIYNNIDDNDDLY